MASATSAASSRPSSNPRDSPVSATGRPKTLPNGIRRAQKSQLDSDPSPPAESNTADQHSHDRLLFLSACAVGHYATIATNAGETFRGIFSGASLEKSATRYVLKMTTRSSTSKDGSANGAVTAGQYVGHGDDHVMTFDPVDIAVCTFSDLQISKTSSRMANGNIGSFKTDTDISGNLAIRERELKPWDASTDGTVDASLNANGHAAWDQFEANERLYGVKTDYDENMYTTSIDRSHPTYRQRALAADRKAREIEGATNSNVHRAALENDMDEEEKYANGVNRDTPPLISSNPNSYKPPARRAPTANPTVSGAPFDPAIISSQLARPDVFSRSAKSPSASSQTAVEPHPTSKKENDVPDANPQDRDMEPKQSPSEQIKPQTSSKLELTPNKVAPPMPSPGRSGNVAENVEKEMLRAFKDFSAHEKLRAQEKQRTQGRKEREVKINDLKKFASNFKLSKPVPDDLIGILAKDPKKQDEIIAKANRATEEKKAVHQKPPPSPEPLKSTTPAQTDTAKPPVNAPVEPSTRGRGQSRGFPPSRHEKFNSSFGSGGIGRGAPPQSFGMRKMQQYPPGAMPNMPPLGPAALQTDLAMRQPMSGVPSSASSASRFNANALEFRPNPTASTFSPSGNPSSMATSVAGSRPVSKAHSPTKRSFFDGIRPKHFSERPSIRDDFNPIKRMKKEAEADPKRYKDNGGIPPAYATKPTWDTRPENENRSSDDIFKQQASMSVPQMMGPGMSMPHQHQLPPHLQQHPANLMGPHMHGPPHNSRYSQPPPMQQNHQYHHDDHRMQLTASQQSYHSPRPQPGVMAQASPMHGQPQQYIAQPQGMYVGQQMMPMGYARPGSAAPQMFNPQTGQPVMMVNGPPNAQYMSGHNQPHMPMYSPNPGQAFPAQPGPGTPSYSPRAPPMMMHQGSQQGHTAPMMYVSQSQQGQHMYYGQIQPQQMHMRGGGYPMQHQASYGASPHMPHQYHMQQRGPQQYSSFPQQQVMHAQALNQSAPHGDVK
ncbi:MAG: hypothetical protein Q9162_001071 [Coniocarpon cinnabarinum]